MRRLFMLEHDREGTVTWDPPVLVSEVTAQTFRDLGWPVVEVSDREAVILEVVEFVRWSGPGKIRTMSKGQACDDMAEAILSRFGASTGQSPDGGVRPGAW